MPITSEANLKSVLKEVELKPTDVSLHTYTGELIPVVGSVEVNATHNAQTATLPLIVVKGPSLLGRNWMEVLQLDWKEIHVTTNNLSLEGVLTRHKEVFRDC